MVNKRTRLVSLAGHWVLVTGTLMLAALPARAARPVPPEYGVRSMVADANKPSEQPRGYAILSVQMVSSDPQNMPPVDEDALISQVCSSLDSHGFHQVGKGKIPEILITVHYGRAWLRNPYLHDTGDSQAIEGFSSIPTMRYPTRDVAGAPTRFMDGLSPAQQAKIQKALLEKLYIRVTGWRYPSDPKAKAAMLWKTTVLVDDPDSWNLNAVAGGMLVAGAPYFDRQITEKELEVHPPVPEGHVNVGAAQVVDNGQAKPAPAAPTSAAPERAAGTGKKFNLPAGDAATTLQVFSRQSGEEIIYPVEQIRGIHTNEVRGEMNARAALDRMLDGTGLGAVQDEKSEALAVRPSPRR